MKFLKNINCFAIAKESAERLIFLVIFNQLNCSILSQDCSQAKDSNEITEVRTEKFNITKNEKYISAATHFLCSLNIFRISFFLCFLPI